MSIGLAVAATGLDFDAVAVAETTDLRDGRIAVVECLEVCNLHWHRSLLVKAVLADTWLGHRGWTASESWLAADAAVSLAPGERRRVVSRHRLVAGRPGRCWFVRWIRFTVVTDRGMVVTNHAASPVRMPGELLAQRDGASFDSWSQPDLLVPASGRPGRRYPGSPAPTAGSLPGLTAPPSAATTAAPVPAGRAAGVRSAAGAGRAIPPAVPVRQPAADRGGR